MARLSNNALTASLPDEVPMSFMPLILERPGERAAQTELENRMRYDQMIRFSEDLKSRGLLTISQSLKADTSAVRVRNEGNRVSIEPRG